MILQPATLALDRLAAAIARLEQQGFVRLAGEPAEALGDEAIVLLTADPERNAEVLDACVILPEALKGLRAPTTALTRWVADPAESAIWRERHGVARAPAVLLFRKGRCLGQLTGIRDWAAYQRELAALWETD